MLASSAYEDIKLWEVSNGSLIRTLTVYQLTVHSVAFSPDGVMLASGVGRSSPRSRGKINLWRVSDGSLLQTYDAETGMGVRSIQFSPNGRLFGYGRYDATVVMARNPFAQDKHPPKNYFPFLGGLKV